MPQLTSLEEFRRFRREAPAKPESTKPCLVICAGTGGQASGSNDIMRVIKREIVERDLRDKISLRITGCLGFCEMDPFIIVEPGYSLYPKLKMEDVPRIIDAALAGEVLDDLLYREPGTVEPRRSQSDIPFFSGQTRTILGSNQELDPIRVLDYIEVGGYAAVEKVLASPDPEWIIEEIKRSELRGRGGGGFLTGRKWELARKSDDEADEKFVVCNADEGDPGAYMDRSILEGNPHAVLEGMLIAGVAIGAKHGIIYVRSEYPLAIKHARIAIAQARDLGTLGQNILGTGIDFDVDIVRGAGAFVCGEETALIRSIEGKMGEPQQRPPYPISRGIFGRPTCINNVETLANVPVIIDGGADEYVKVGVPGNRGTKIFSLVGKIRNTGLVEVPLGTPISRIVHEIGGGPIGKAKIKAVQTGGPSGGCIPAERFDLPIDYDSLTQAGSMMGSGGMIVMDENTCMVDVAKYFMSFLKDESCGKCFTCRKGTQRMYEILDDITKGKGTLEELDLLEELAHVVQDSTMCGLGQSASNPVLSTIRYFRQEYERHIVDKRCDAFVCAELVGAPCHAACPIGTEAWRYVAHIERGEYEDAYQVIRDANPFPSVCARVCNHPCEERCRAATSGGQAIAIRSLKRFVTDTVDPASYKPPVFIKAKPDAKRIAVVGAGPAGLSAAYRLSLKGYRVTVFDDHSEPGGMLLAGIPAYRLPREALKKEMDTLINENVTLKCGTSLGRDVTIDGLLEDGHDAVFLALGAHKSRRLDAPGEDAAGVYPAMAFLKAFNLEDKSLAKGRVGVIGGGNSAVDAARTALRQDGVESVTIIYRRTRREMPAYDEEIEAALDEGIGIETLVAPVKVHSEAGTLTGIECIRNELGDPDSSGRRRPVAIPGTEHTVPLDTLIVAISEEPDAGLVAPMGIELTKWGTIPSDPVTLATERPGVFAGGDVVRGPNTVVDAIADGKRAAEMIDLYLRGEDMRLPERIHLPDFYIQQGEEEGEFEEVERAVPPHAPVEARKRDFSEVELTLPVEAALREAKRCLRCDLEFTEPKEAEAECVATKGEAT
jgi:NADH-quinone oxidoreductase subunit F